jgi:hypothetical protein
MQNHNDRHQQRNNMHEAGRTLEDNRVGELDIPRIAIGLDAMAPLNRRDLPHLGAERNRCLLANRVEVAETHRGGSSSLEIF